MIPERLGNRIAKDIRLKSCVDQPLEELAEIQRSLLFAECSMIAYLPFDECVICAGKMGWDVVTPIDCSGAHAFWFENSNDSVIVFRGGVEPREWSDIRADANALTSLADTVGKIHRGFKSEVDVIWPRVEEALEKNEKTLWFTGHSVGAALANISSGRCLVSRIRSEPKELHTFGSPRVGSQAFVQSSKVRHIRWVNHDDPVTRVPPVWLGYRHSGEERRVNGIGQLQKMSIWRRGSEHFRDFVKAMLNGQRGRLPDHSIDSYIEVIFNRLRADGLKPAAKRTVEPIAN